MDLDLDVLPGEIFTIIGRAGSGKTTLLEALVGLRRVAADRLEVCGHHPFRMPRALRQRLGVALAHTEASWAAMVAAGTAAFGAIGFLIAASAPAPQTPPGSPPARRVVITGRRPSARRSPTSRLLSRARAGARGRARRRS